MTASRKKVSSKSPEKPSGDGPLENEPDFEQSIAELERLVTHMEQGEPTLKEMLENFERGVELSNTCRKLLDGAEQHVRILMEKEGGFEAEPFNPDLPFSEKTCT